MSKDINILYVSNIVNILYKNSRRSGIFFVAYNLLNELLKYQDINVTLYCDKNRYLEYKKMIKEYYPNLKLLSNIPVNCLSEYYLKIKSRKIKAKQSNKKLKKNFYNLILMVISPIFKITCFINKYNNMQYKKYDAILSSHLAIPQFLRENKNIKKFTILHDMVPLLFPELNRDFRYGGWFREMLFTLNYNDYYFTDSENTRNDFLRYNPIDPDKIKTVPLATNDNFYPAGTDEIEKVKIKYNIPQDKKYLFSLCSIDPRKNLVRILKTYCQFIEKHNIDNLYFVVGGGHFPEFIEQFEQELENFKDFKDKIIRIGYVDDEDLAPLYSGAEWFVYTSQYEGFGLPPLEAMSCGCPVITSNNSSLPEVVGDAGIMIDWDSDEQHIEAYEKYYFNEAIREEYRQKGLNRAKLFSWQKFSDNLIKVIKANIN